MGSEHCDLKDTCGTFFGAGLEAFKRDQVMDFPGSSVFKTLSFYCRAHEFDLGSGN